MHLRTPLGGGGLCGAQTTWLPEQRCEVRNLGLLPVKVTGLHSQSFGQLVLFVGKTLLTSDLVVRSVCHQVASCLSHAATLL